MDQKNVHQSNTQKCGKIDGVSTDGQSTLLREAQEYNDLLPDIV